MKTVQVDYNNLIILLINLAWYRETALSERWISLLEDLTIVVVLFLRLKDLPLSGPSMTYNLFIVLLSFGSSKAGLAL